MDKGRPANRQVNYPYWKYMNTNNVRVYYSLPHCKTTFSVTLKDLKRRGFSSHSKFTYKNLTLPYLQSFINQTDHKIEVTGVETDIKDKSGNFKKEKGPWIYRDSAKVFISYMVDSNLKTTIRLNNLNERGFPIIK